MTTPATGWAPPAPQAPTQPPQPPRELTGADLSVRIAANDQNFPRELWGKTIGEAMRYYAIMRQDFINRNQGPQPGQPPLVGQPAGPTAQPPAAPVASAQPPARTWQPSAAPPAPAAPAGGFDPSQMRDMIREEMRAALNTSSMATVSIQTVYQQVRAEFPDWPQYDAEIQASVASADPETKLNPELWRGAYYFVKGKALSQGQPAYVPRDAQGRDSRGAIVTPPPPMAPAFTESPTPPPSNTDTSVNDPNDFVWAARFNIPVEEYRAWKNGNVPAPQRPAAPQPPFGGGFDGRR